MKILKEMYIQEHTDSVKVLKGCGTFFVQTGSVSEVYYVEVQMSLLETVPTKRPEIWPNSCFLHHDNAATY